MLLVGLFVWGWMLGGSDFFCIGVAVFFFVLIMNAVFYFCTDGWDIVGVWLVI